MSKIIYLTPPAHGHVNPALPVVQELTQRGEQILCYNTEEFRSELERTGATFRAYPATDLTSTEISRVLQNGNLASVTGLILRATGQLLPFVLDELAREKPDLVIFDSIALWGKMATTQLRLRAAASICLAQFQRTSLCAPRYRSLKSCNARTSLSRMEVSTVFMKGCITACHSSSSRISSSSYSMPVAWPRAARVSLSKPACNASRSQQRGCARHWK